MSEKLWHRLSIMPNFLAMDQIEMLARERESLCQTVSYIKMIRKTAELLGIFLESIGCREFSLADATKDIIDQWVKYLMEVVGDSAETANRRMGIVRRSIAMSYGKKFFESCGVKHCVRLQTESGKKQNELILKSGEKKCGYCLTVKPIGQFSKSTYTIDGFQGYCRPCCKISNKKWRDENPEKERSRRKRYNKDNRDKLLLKYKEYHINNLWKILIKSARIRARKNKLAFDLDEYRNEIRSRVEPMICEMSGANMVSGSGANGRQGGTILSPSIDKIDPSKGYVYSNIRIVCLGLNMLMMDIGEESAFDLASVWVDKVRADMAMKIAA